LGFFGDGEGAVVDCGKIEVVENAGYIVFFGECFSRWDIGGGGEVFLVLRVKMLVGGRGGIWRRLAFFVRLRARKENRLDFLPSFSFSFPLPLSFLW
jgi:hypothetical protein